VSENALSVMPAGPRWQPAPDAGDRAAALVLELVSGPPDADHTSHAGPDAVELDVDRYEALTPVDCGQNLASIRCPHRDGPIDPRWYRAPLDEYDEQGDGLPTLDVTTRCCATGTSLDRSDYDWPCGFARFEIAAWNPRRSFPTTEEPADARVLGHPVRRTPARIRRTSTCRTPLAPSAEIRKIVRDRIELAPFVIRMVKRGGTAGERRLRR
jgi:hypothetical protein